MRCPICDRLETGRVAADQYYCRRCCVEFHGAPGAWRLFSVDLEGNLVAADPETAGASTAASGSARAAYPLGGCAPASPSSRPCTEPIALRG